MQYPRPPRRPQAHRARGAEPLRTPHRRIHRRWNLYLAALVLLLGVTTAGWYSSAEAARAQRPTEPTQGPALALPGLESAASSRAEQPSVTLSSRAVGKGS